MNSLLDVRNLRMHIYARRGIVKAVDGISFSLGRGETIGLVGESGSGKTMTSLSLLKLQPRPGGRIVGGQIILDGEDLVPKSDRAMRAVRGKKISMILQDPMTSLNPAYAIGDQIAEGMTLHQGVAGKALWDRVVELLRLMQIPGAGSRLRDYPHQLSGGMRQRVAGAIAISSRPAVLIADEPTTSLDVTTQLQYLRLLQQIQAEFGLGIIFVTHDLAIVARICDKVAVMYAGRMVERAPTNALFDTPRHPYTLALMQCVPALKAQWQELMPIPGHPPDLGNLPPGCSFAPRCSKADEMCRHQSPGELQVGQDHYASCWHPEVNA